MSDGSFWSTLKARYLVKKPLSAAASQAERTELRRTLGAWDLTALGIGAIVGAGIFVTLGVVAADYTGPAVVISLVLAAILCAITAFAYAELATMMPLGGSAYSYTYSSMGEVFAWIIGWALVLEYAIGNMAVATGFSANLQPLFEGLGFALPQALTNVQDGVFDLYATLIVFFVTLLLLRPVKESAGLNAALVVMKLGILVFFIAVAAPNINAANLNPFFRSNPDAPLTGLGYFFPGDISRVLTGVGIIFFAFIGFDAVSTAAEETKDPGRNVPRGIIYSLLACTVLYALVAISLTGIARSEDLGTGDPLAEGLRIVGFENAAIILNVGGLLATLSVLLVFQLGTARIFYTLARDGLLPQWLAKVNQRYGTPNRITLTMGAFVALGAGLLPLGFLVTLTNIGTLFAFALVMGSVLILRKTHPDAPRPFRAPLVPLLPAIGILGCLIVVAYLPVITFLGFIAWMGLGLMIYALYGARSSRMRAPALEEALAAPEPEFSRVPVAAATDEPKGGALSRLAQKGQQKK